MSRTSCADCGSRTRKLPHPGPRCATCHRIVRRGRSERAHGARVEATYGITPERYAALYEAQGGRCAICRRATGKTRRLSVDHDHACCKTTPACGKCVRGLLCRPCNSMLGHARDDVGFFVRAGRYLLEPPALSLSETA